MKMKMDTVHNVQEEMLHLSSLPCTWRGCGSSPEAGSRESMFEATLAYPAVLSCFF